MDWITTRQSGQINKEHVLHMYCAQPFIFNETFGIEIVGPHLVYNNRK